MDPEAGGVSQAVNMMVKGSADTGIKHEVACLDEKGAPFLAKYDFIIHALGARKTGWAFNPLLLPWLKNNLGDFDFAIVHGLWQYQSYAVLTAIRKVKKPLVYVMPHGMLDPYFQKAPERRLKAIRNWIIWHLIEKRLIRQARGLLFTCEMERQLAGKSFGNSYKPRAEHVVGLGIDEPPVFETGMVERFKKHCGLGGNSRYFLFLSRIHPKKGVDMLVRSYLQLKAASDNVPALVIAGPGIETEYGMEIKRLTGEDPGIFFPGMLIDDMKWGAFYGAEAFVLPSHQENFGIAVAEALACSIPVLISDKINIYGEVKKDHGGLVQADTEEGTCLLLRQWADFSQDQKREMGKNARVTFENNFSIQKSTANLVTLFLSGNGQSSIK